MLESANSFFKLRLAKEIIELFLLLSLKLISTEFAVYIFGTYSPLVDANLYLSGVMISDVAFRTRMVQILTTFIFNLGGDIFTHWIFGVISLAGFIYYKYKGGAVKWLIYLTLLFPSNIIWTSIVGKEAIFYGAFTLVIVVWTRYAVRRCNKCDLIFLVIATFICFILRPHYALVICWLFASASLIGKSNIRIEKWRVLFAVFFCILLFILFGTDLAYRGFSGIEPTARASRFDFFGIEPGTPKGFSDFQSLLPLGAILGIVGPMPNELILRPIFTPFFIEGVLILFSPLILYWHASSNNFQGKRWFKAIFCMCIIPALVGLMVLHAPFGLLNPGSAIRWRVNFQAAFIFAPILLYFEFLKADKNANRTLSS